MDETIVNESKNYFLAKYKNVILAAATLLLVLTACYFILYKKNDPVINLNDYHALFLTNGQVYFGKITRINRKNVVIEDVYYLQSTNQEPSVTSQETRFNLVKLGKELHEPEDKMIINSDHVMFYEILKEDSKVMQSIKSAKTIN